MPVKPSSKSWWYLLRVSVGALMILVLLIGAGLGWTMHIVHAARMQRESVAAIEKAGGDVVYDCDLNPNHTVRIRRLAYVRWLDRRVGIDYFTNVVEIVIPRDLTDADLVLVGRFPRLETIWCGGSHASVTDAGLAYLGGLAILKELDLWESGITDAGLAHIKGMKSLKQLNLSGTRITDAGLVHLSGMASLQTLDLSHTDIGAAGVVHVKKLTSLRSLDLRVTHVDDFDVQELRRALRKASILFQRIFAR